MTDNIKQMPQTFRVRTDRAATLPEDMLVFLNWKIGDELTYTIDLKHSRLTIERVSKTDDGVTDEHRRTHN